jgi:protein required for attachment to host cells
VKPMRTWILIADGSGARILEALGEGSGFHPVSGDGTLRDAAPRSLEGREDAAGGSQRGNAIASRPNVADALEVLFASQLAAMLAGYVRSNAFDRLVIVAPSTMLGGLRKMIGPNVRERIVAEIDKDLTKIPNSEISTHLDDVIAL